VGNFSKNPIFDPKEAGKIFFAGISCRTNFEQLTPKTLGSWDLRSDGFQKKILITHLYKK